MDRTREALELTGMMERVALGLGIEVRYEILVPDGEAGSVRGGLCRHGDRELILIDSRLGPVERCAALADALRSCDLEAIFVPPAIRRLVGGG